jgi:hypothetical protein
LREVDDTRGFGLATPQAEEEAVIVMLRGRVTVFAFSAACVVLVGARSSAAQNNIAAAAKAFSLGQQAELAGDFRAASEHYELADRMVPSPEALRSAARARMRAGDEPMAATHAEELDRRYSDDKSHQIASEILSGLSQKLGRISLTCEKACGVVVDGGAIGVDEATEHVFYVEAGRHTIGASFGTGGTAQQMIEAPAGKTARLSLSVPEGAEASSGATAQVSAGAGGPKRAGLPIGWFIASAGATALLAGATVWSGLDVLKHKSDYEEDPTKAKLDDGRTRELRTNILIGVTAAGAVATGFIAWKTRWKTSTERAPATTVSFAPTVGGGVVLLGGDFR